jgi:hypothetical protein
MVVILSDWVSEQHLYACSMSYRQAYIDEVKKHPLTVEVTGENCGFFRGPFVYVTGPLVSGYFKPCYFEPCKDPGPI